ncbi:MAG: STT3 domain-containing protein [Candidatus Aenigmatarchaeota archaeon]
MDVINVLKGKWWVFVLLAILFFSYHIRAINIVEDRVLSFDPIFQYRYTKYFADWGHMPAWDELTYYTGRLIEINTSPTLMFYMTSVIYWILAPMGMSLLTVCAYMSAVYGAMIIIPAFLLGRELSNKYGGLLTALLVGTAPQILTRTFGSSYDTDQVVLFFLVLTLYLGYYALKKKSIFSYCMALIGFAGFLMTWGYSFYSFAILAIFAIIYFLMKTLLGDKGFRKADLTKNLKGALEELKQNILMLVALLSGLAVFAAINYENIIFHITNVIGFAFSAEAWIVNISIAELQPFNIFSLEGWITATGRFVMGNSFIDITILLIFALFIIAGFALKYRKIDTISLSFMLTLFLIGIYTTFKGIRFTELTSTFFITLIGVGFGSLVEMVDKKDAIYKATIFGIALFLAFNVLQIGNDLGTQLGPDINANWDSAWEFLKTDTPELSIVGTWWDPGHMINSLAERRNYADGAHCHNQCLYTINDRITDLGKIMATTDENKSFELVRKYQGSSPASYWIASDDLIGKFRWLQYFGMGCDGVTDPSCPLYIQLGQTSQSVDENNNVMFVNYDMSQTSKVAIYNAQLPIPIFVEGINIALFDEFIFYNGTTPVPVKFSQEELEDVIIALKPLESQLNARFTNQTIPMTIWLPRHYQYIVIIPPNLRNVVFTKMFMLEGQGLDHFKQVFRNEQVKIYEVI